MTFARKTLVHLAVLACMSSLAVVAQAQNNPPAAPASAASAPGGASGAASAPRPPDPNALKPFAEVIRDAKRSDGFIPLWRKDEKVWLELRPEQLNQPLLFTVNVRESVGERGLYSSQMGPDWMVEFRRIGNSLQVVARNMDFRGGDDAATKAFVRQGFSDSLLAAGPVVSAPHTESKSFLVDASLLLTDLLGYGTALEFAFRMPYSLDRANSSFEASRVDEQLTSLQARLHYATPRIPAPPLMPTPVPVPPPPAVLPDPRSLFVGVTYNFSKLPEAPMRPRLADPRLGHFTEAFTDYANENRQQQRVHYLKRWRLEKKEPQAPLSEPVKPITFWLDKNIPQRYRAAVEAGVLEWNKAFERIGFKNALEAKQQADGDDYDTSEGNRASIRWYVGVDAGFARGPSHSDPRTGEILDADISMGDGFARGIRRLLTEDLSSKPTAQPPKFLHHRHGHDASEEACDHAEESAGQLNFALDLLEARGELDPDSPEVERLVNQYITETITHEVGHTLGLKHNFKASTASSLGQLRDSAYAREHGLSASVMDYVPFNLPLNGEPRSELVQGGLGAYDYLAIEYAYKPLDEKEEAAALEAIAARTKEPGLAFGDDADNFGPNGVDPTINQFDLGDDPLAWYQRRFALTRELWQRVQARKPQVGEDPLRSRRSLMAGFRQLGIIPGLAAKYVGGLYVDRSVSASGTASAAYRPVEPERQREALKLLTTQMFSADSFRFRPEFLSTVQSEYLEWRRSGPVSIASMVGQLQSQALDRLMAAGTVQRVLEQQAFLPEKQRKTSLTLDELFSSLQTAIWSELKASGEVDPLRRNLQRDYLRRLQNLLTKPVPNMPADAISLARWHAGKLQADLRTAVAKPNLSVESRAHLQESLSGLSEALKASMNRS